MLDDSGGLTRPPDNEKMQIADTGDSDKQQLVSEDNNKISSQQPNVDSKNYIDYENKYRPSDSGPYYIFVEHKDKNAGRLFPIRIGYYLRFNDVYKKAIVDIQAVGINRVKVVLNSFRAANELVNHEILTNKGYISYIPKFYTQRKGIVRQVDTYFSEEYLTTAIECDKKVTSVKRMKKRVRDSEGETKLVDRQMIIVSFLGSDLPGQLRINGVNFTVEPYVYPVVQCMKCLRYGHIDKLCKQNEKVCRRCSDKHDTEDCPNDYKYCFHCKSSQHVAVSRECPMFQKQKRINEIMASKNLSFKEAEALERNPSYSKIVLNNKFNLLADDKNFPALPNSSSYSNSLQTNTIYRPRIQTRPQTQTQRKTQTQPSAATDIIRSKKRKAAKSSPVTPNPYRDEFMEYKQILTEKITILISQLLTSIMQTNDSTNISIEHLNLKDSISSLINSLVPEDSSDDDSTY